MQVYCGWSKKRMIMQVYCGCSKRETDTGNVGIVIYVSQAVVKGRFDDAGIL